MKKIKFNIMAVVAMAIAFSTFAFKATEAKKATLEWFTISGNHSPGTPVPSADASYIGPGTTPPPASGCSSTASYQCVSGFDPGDVNVANKLKDDSQIPEHDLLRRN